MTRVLGSDAGAAGQGGLSRDDSLQSNRQAHARADARPGDVDGRRRAGDKLTKAAETADRSVAFQQKMKAARFGDELEPAKQAGERRESLFGVGAAGLDVDRRSLGGGEHHEADDALAVDLLAVLGDRNAAGELVRLLDEQRRRPGVQAEAVDDGDRAPNDRVAAHRLMSRCRT